MFDDIRARPLASALLLQQLDYVESHSRPLDENIVALALDTQFRAYRCAAWYQEIGEAYRYRPEIWIRVGLALLRSSYLRDEALLRALEEKRWCNHEKEFPPFYPRYISDTAARIANVNNAIQNASDLASGEPALLRALIVRNWRMGVAKRLVADAVEHPDEVFDGGGDLPTFSPAFIQAHISSRVEYECYRVTDAALRTGMPDALIPCLPPWEKRARVERWVYAPRAIGELISNFESSCYRSKVGPHVDRPTIRIMLHSLGLTEHDLVPRLRAELLRVRDDDRHLMEEVKKRGETYGITNRAGTVFNATGASPKACLKAARDARRAKLSGKAAGPQWWQKPTKAQSADREDRWTRWFQFLVDRGLVPASLAGAAK